VVVNTGRNLRSKTDYWMGNLETRTVATRTYPAREGEAQRVRKRTEDAETKNHRGMESSEQEKAVKHKV